MTVQFMRKVKVTLGGHVVDKLKIAFRIEKSTSSDPNVMQSIQIWNLSKSTRQSLGREWTEIEVEAGYEGLPGQGGSNVGLIFKGTIRDVMHPRDGPDIITQISAGEGDKASRTATVSETMEEGADFQKIAQKLHGTMDGISLGQMMMPQGGSGSLPTLARPLVLFGSSQREMNKYAKTFGMLWSVQNGALEAIPSDGFIPGNALISPLTGMIGKPAKTDGGVKCSALLNPQVMPNRSITVQSEEVSGEFRVDTAVFEGDNGAGDQAGPFVVHIEASEVGGGTGGGIGGINTPTGGA